MGKWREAGTHSQLLRLARVFPDARGGQVFARIFLTHVLQNFVFSCADPQADRTSGHAEQSILRRECFHPAVLAGDDSLAGRKIDQASHLILPAGGHCGDCLHVADLRVLPEPRVPARCLRRKALRWKLDHQI